MPGTCPKLQIINDIQIIKILRRRMGLKKNTTQNVSRRGNTNCDLTNDIETSLNDNIQEQTLICDN